MRASNAAIENLRKVALFSACTKDELRKIMSASTEMKFSAGTVLANEGAVGHEFMVIAEGNARVDIGGKTIAQLGAGDFFGEISLLDGGPRTATVTAETDLVADVIGQREFAALIETAPHLARKLLKGLALRLRAADMQLYG
jgi:CRP/FNR family transcriptional regulator, cyclic AMP receptor protein